MMIKKKFLILFIAVILLIGLLYAAVRPPVLDPDDVPFPYDPNMCESDPLAWYFARPNTTIVQNIRGIDDDGDGVVFALLSGASGVLIQRGLSIPDANDPSAPDRVVHHATWTWTTPAELKVYYLNFQVMDVMGSTDERTILVNVRENTPPVLDIGEPMITWNWQWRL